MGVVTLGVECGDEVDSGTTVNYAVPSGCYVQTKGTDNPHAGDHHPVISIHTFPAHTLVKAQLRAFTNHN